MTRTPFSSRRWMDLLPPSFSFAAFSLGLCGYLSFRIVAFLLDKLSPETDEVYARFACWVLDRFNLFFLIDSIPFPGMTSGLQKAAEQISIDSSGNFYTLPSQHLLLLILSGMFLWALFGMAICRCFSRIHSGSGTPNFLEALDFSKKKLGTSLSYAGFLAMVSIFFYLAGGVLGLLVQVPWGIGSVLSLAVFPILLLLAALFFLIVMVGALGSGLFCAAVAEEDGRGMEPFLRTFGVIYSRLLPAVLYGFLVAILFALVFFVSFSLLPRLILSPVQIFRFDPVLEEVAGRAATQGLEVLAELPWTHGILFLAIWAVLNGIRWAAIGWAISFYFSASLVFFLLFRENEEGEEDAKVESLSSGSSRRLR